MDRERAFNFNLLRPPRKRMDKEQPFNFSLLLPPRSSPGQVSTVKPQDHYDSSSGHGFESLQGSSTCFNLETNASKVGAKFSNTGTILPTKATRPDVSKKMVVLPMEKEEMMLKSSHLYSKLFEEAEKIKSWKLRIDSELLQRDKKLQENKRIMETQRKAIQELQFANESLSMKLEDQIHENEDLRNKNNSTRNLCNILKDTFETTAEKMIQFETEREETHHIFIECHGNIQGMIAAFEGLRIKAEHDQKEALKVRESLQQIKNLKETFEKEQQQNQDEVVNLQGKLAHKEKEFKEILFSFQETQAKCTQLCEASEQQFEMLQSCEKEKEILAQKLKLANELQKESKEKENSIAHTLDVHKQENAKILAEKDNRLTELTKIKDQHLEQIAVMQETTLSLQSLLAAETQRVENLEIQGSTLSEQLNNKQVELVAATEKINEAEKLIHLLKEDMDKKTSAIRNLEELMQGEAVKCSELTEELETNKCKLQEVQEQLSFALLKEEKSQKEIEKLKKDTKIYEVRTVELMESMHKLQFQKQSIEKQVEGGVSEAKTLESLLKESKENEEKKRLEIECLHKENNNLRVELESLKKDIEMYHEEAENVKKKIEFSKSSQNELSKKDRQIKALDLKLETFKTKLENKTKAHEDCQKENKVLLTEVAAQKEKHKCLQSEINALKQECQKSEKEMQAVQTELRTKTASEAELQDEVQKFKQSESEALRIKKNTEIECQHKISDMVALLDKHKNQYDKLVEEKVAELELKQKQVTEITTIKTSLELQLSQMQIENGQLKEQLANEKKEKENLEQDILSLKKQTKSLKKKKPKDLADKQIFESERCWNMSNTSSANRSVFEFSKGVETDSSVGTSSTRKDNDPHKATWASHIKVGATPRIKSFRVRTPPSTEKTKPWRAGTLQLDPKSDSSEQNGLQALSPNTNMVQTKHGAGTGQKSVDVLKKTQSPAIHKSPGTALKLAAMKRLRDAGWTTVINSDRKKKKNTEKIFA
ncbi:synaptonemal complex protein 1 isoform X2 [Denticeps clupeoides]|uniref:synaptonemal complex protein 1 isoform X2 n=1 Tax=Denticeps clupeoides TaxID=299321 RepID=UPI0010A58581|nr:synaptonemal complex protein 1-like isoform X2 [Denticeps clupeoides]